MFDWSPTLRPFPEAAEPFVARPTLVAAPARSPRFRPDIEGLRAIAVCLVVAYHADLLGTTAGYVGVDVFFVISGFLITRLLIDQCATEPHAGNLLATFYARRIRRLLPLATTVIIATLWSSYHWLGFLRGNDAAVDGRWSAGFLANIRFARLGTDYLGSQELPSPLQHYWSLAVEEQFYLVWPALVLLLTRLGRALRRPRVLGVAITAITVASFAWCVVQTPRNGTWAYFSPATRAWELGVGALVAVGTARLDAIGRRGWTVIGWSALVATVASAYVFDASTAFPGTAALLPVVGTALVLASGALSGPTVSVLTVLPLQWIGKLSYSLYLWHWPLLIIAEGRDERALDLTDRLLLIGAAFLLSIISYFVMENPIRHSRFLARNPVVTYAFGAALVASSFVYASYLLSVY